MNKIFKVFLSLFVLMGLSKGISCNEVIVTINGITYNCIAVGGDNGTILLKDCFKIYNLIGDTQCFGVLRRADVDELPDISDPGGGTGVTPGGGDGGSPTDPSDTDDPINPDPVDDPDPEDCQCNVCNVCGGCIREEGELLMDGCEPCKCCRGIYRFKCIRDIDNICNVKYFESALLNTVIHLSQYLIDLFDENNEHIMEQIADNISDELSNEERLMVKVCYTQGSLDSWESELISDYDSQVILKKLNETTLSMTSGPVSNRARRIFYRYNLLTNDETYLFEVNDFIENNYIPLSEIERDGIPQVGQKIEKPYYHYAHISNNF